MLILTHNTRNSVAGSVLTITLELGWGGGDEIRRARPLMELAPGEQLADIVQRLPVSLAHLDRVD